MTGNHLCRTRMRGCVRESVEACVEACVEARGRFKKPPVLPGNAEG